MTPVARIQATGVYRLTDLADGLDISVRTLQRAAAEGSLATVRVGRRSFVTGRSILAWLQAEKVDDQPDRSEIASALAGAEMRQ